MRIVIDLQTTQLHGYEHGQGREALALAMALLEARAQHRFWILLNGALPHIADLRQRLGSVLDPDQIRVFETLAPSNFADPANTGRRRANELTREHTIAQLQADAVLIFGLFDGYGDASVYSASQFSGGAQLGILLAGVPSEDTGHETGSQAFRDERMALLRHAALVLAPLNVAGSTDELGADRVLALDAADPGRSASAILARLAALDSVCPAATKPGHTRRRLAFVSPLPPERTGIADYAAQLLPAMLDDFDITLIVQQQEVTLPPILMSLPRHNTAWLADHAHEFDQLIYQFGNSPFHSDMFGLLCRHPGVVVLHDFFLSNVLAYEQMTGGIPNAWSDALFYSHGYRALQASQLPDNHAEAMNEFPCNREVLEGATRVIVHSEYSLQLAREWYGPEAGRNWTVVPLPRAAPPQQDRHAARTALGIDDDTFLVCTFGYISPSKLSHVLVDAWIASNLHQNAKCMLMLVGANHPGEFGANLVDTIDNAGATKTVRITGWADETVYHQYLQAADAGVQLRATSRGETSAAVLDVMNYGIPTIVNANGSMAALPVDAVWMLPNEFNQAELVVALETLHGDAERRLDLGNRARDVLRNQHRPDHCAARYRDALDLAMAEAESSRHALLETLLSIPGLRQDDSTLRTLAVGLAHAPDPLSPRQLLVDVSAIVHHDLKTGIERVVRTQLLELLKLRQQGVRVEPVYLSTQGNRWHYRYARSYALKLLGASAPTLHDVPIDLQEGDIFYSADYSPAAVCEAARAGIYTQMRRAGVSISFLIHDLLPVLRPEFFPSNSAEIHAKWLRCIAVHADRLLCISSAVASETREWLSGQAAELRLPKIAVLHHGADIDYPEPAPSDPALSANMIATLAARPSFLMVGTIEPRKGHPQAIEAFEQLWAEGVDVNLVIVGREGWKPLPESERRTIPKIVSTMKHHPEAGQRLLWLQGVDDGLLGSIYRASACLLAPSEGEGFGLPLIEAARYGLPILARALPVFMEVAGEHATYFDGMDPAVLADAVRAWLRQRADSGVPASSSIPAQTWRDNVKQLLNILTASNIEAQSNLLTPTQ
jgi:glycosyltransferase involved in cell wall biosynthesis